MFCNWFESSASHASHNEYGPNQGQSSISKIYANACNVSEVCDDNEGETITHSQNNIINNGSTHTRPALPLLRLLPPLQPVLLSPLVPNIQTSSSTLNKDKTVVRKGEERNLGSSNTSSKKENREEVEKEEREEAKRRILEENPHISKDALEFMLSLPVERKIPKSRNLKLYMQQQSSNKKWTDYRRKIIIRNKALSPCISIIANLVITGIYYP
ncbi:MAG TPA: hypothetical protein VE223_04525 [Nitrososphaeraceae archaeon]|nr:hypothetical protein [Nitrososphaeraceae archaeon]